MEEYTFLTYGNNKSINNVRVNHNPSLTFYPGNYNNKFFKKDTFELKI